MQTTSSNARNHVAPRSASEATPTGAIPSARQARAMRTATSPRLATSRRWNIRPSLLSRLRDPYGAALDRYIDVVIPQLLAALLVFARMAPGAPDEFTEQLARLGAARADERAAAERWLEAHLVIERYPELAGAARAGDAEVRARLARVLSSDPRHLGLALALSAEKDAGLAALGREAVRAGVARA